MFHFREFMLNNAKLEQQLLRSQYIEPLVRGFLMWDVCIIRQCTFGVGVISGNDPLEH